MAGSWAKQELPPLNELALALILPLWLPGYLTFSSAASVKTKRRLNAWPEPQRLFLARIFVPDFTPAGSLGRVWHMTTLAFTNEKTIYRRGH